MPFGLDKMDGNKGKEKLNPAGNKNEPTTSTLLPGGGPTTAANLQMVAEVDPQIQTDGEAEKAQELKADSSIWTCGERSVKLAASADCTPRIIDVSSEEEDNARHGHSVSGSGDEVRGEDAGAEDQEEEEEDDWEHLFEEEDQDKLKPFTEDQLRRLVNQEAASSTSSAQVATSSTNSMAQPAPKPAAPLGTGAIYPKERGPPTESMYRRMRKRTSRLKKRYVRQQKEREKKEKEDRDKKRQHEN